MAKKVKAVTGDSMTRLNRISPLSNFLFKSCRKTFHKLF